MAPRSIGKDTVPFSLTGPLDPLKYQRWMRGHEPDVLGDDPSTIIVVDSRSKRKQIPSALKKFRKRSRKSNGLRDFLGLVPGSEDAVAIQKEMRRERH